MAPLQAALRSRPAPPWVWPSVQLIRVVSGAGRAAMHKVSAPLENAPAEKTARAPLQQAQHSRSSRSMGTYPRYEHHRYYSILTEMYSYDNLDFFNPSTTDGFNIPLTITPGTGCGCPYTFGQSSSTDESPRQ